MARHCYSLILLLLLTKWPDFCDSQGQACPSCQQVDCFPTLLPQDCPEDTLYLPDVVYGCCPACVKYLDYHDICAMEYVDLLTETEKLPCTTADIRAFKSQTSSPSSDWPVIQVFQCGPGYVCQEDEEGLHRCEVEKSYLDCAMDQATYQDWWDTQAESNTCTRYDWEKSCTPKGNYARIQAKFSKFTQQKAERKFCVDPKGNRIFGAGSAEDEEMNCRCSRKAWELQSEQTGDRITIHCQDNGNYEELQCDQERCWCVNSKSGRVTSRVVHQDLKEYLSCYDSETIGDQYLRRCESREHGKTRSRRIMALHGLTWSSVNGFKCDFDGSFAAVNCKEDENRCGCVDKTNKWISTYYAEASQQSLFNCKCARDKMADDSIGLICDKNGNYDAIQKFSSPSPGIEYCVDSDGFQYTPKYPMPSGPLEKRCFIYDCEARQNECYGVMPNGTLYDNGQCQDCPSQCRDTA